MPGTITCSGANLTEAVPPSSGPGTDGVRRCAYRFAIQGAQQVWSDILKPGKVAVRCNEVRCARNGAGKRCSGAAVRQSNALALRCFPKAAGLCRLFG